MIWRIIAAVVVLSVTAGAAAKKEHVAERFDVTAAVQPDGSLEIVETIAFRFSGGEFTIVERELRGTETDGVQVIDAAMDGRVLPRGDGAGQVEIDASLRRARILWHFAPIAEGVHRFTLRYRYAGVVRHGEGEDWFRWPPFPTRFDYPIEAGTVRLSWPEGTRLRRLPDVEGPVASTTPEANAFVVTVANYRQRDDDVRMTVRFEPGAFTGAEPAWERDATRADRMAPAFWAGAAMILAATILAVWLFFLRYQRERVERSSRPVAAAPDDLPAAIGGAIMDGRFSLAWPQLLAAVFEMARRGALRIEQETTGGLFNRPRFLLRRGDAGTLRPHERAVIDALFKDGEDSERFDRALQRLRGRIGKVKRAMHGELDAARFIDAERREGGRALAISGGVVMVLAGVVGAVAIASDLRLGQSSLAVPLALLVAGLVLFVVGATFSTLTQAGLRAAREWEGYQRHLKAEIKASRLPNDGEAVGRLLPYAAALGVLPAFGKALEKMEIRHLPSWLRTLDAAGGSAAMVAVITAGSRSMSHGAGGTGGGGVGGGGASSAR